MGSLWEKVDTAIDNSSVYTGRKPQEKALIGQLIGRAVHGYLSGSTVFVDANGNSRLDLGENSTTTDSLGNFSLLAGTGPLVVFGGTDTSTGLPFKGELSAPGSRVITPLTTLINDLAPDPSAEQTVLTGLGLSSNLDLTTLDPIAAAMAGDPVGAATEVAGAKVYDTVSLIASALAGAGGNFGTSANDTFAAIANAINNGGIDLTDHAALSGLVTNVAQTEGVSLGPSMADSVASIIAASNTALDQKGQADGSGSQLLSDTAAIELLAQGAASNAIEQAGSDPTRLQNVVAAFTGTSLDNLTAAASTQRGTTDDDTGEQMVLTLTIGTGLIGQRTAAQVPFTIAGLDLEDTGAVTFTDIHGNTVQVDVNGGQTSYTADLSSLADGAITASMQVATDAAGNSFLRSRQAPDKPLVRSSDFSA
jgi:hypothetical protein